MRFVIYRKSKLLRGRDTGVLEVLPTDLGEIILDTAPPFLSTMEIAPPPPSLRNQTKGAAFRKLLRSAPILRSSCQEQAEINMQTCRAAKNTLEIHSKVYIYVVYHFLLKVHSKFIAKFKSMLCTTFC